MHTYKISIIGAGNVGIHLATNLFNAGHTIVQVFSRTKANARLLASMVKASAITNLKNVNDEADVFIISVNDDAVEEVAASLPVKEKIILHTSASVSSKPVKRSSNHFGVLYPLQTFSKTIPVDMSTVPVFINGENNKVKKAARDIASSITSRTYEVSDNKRIGLHVAAVFANNFTNHIMALSEKIIKKEGFNFDLLKPLIENTFEKVKDHHPIEAQTGPAVRKDKTTLAKHRKYLKNDKQLLKIYNQLTESIQNLKEKK